MSDWIKCSDKLPEIDYTGAIYSHSISVIGCYADSQRAMEVRYCSNGYAKTEKGRAPRWERDGLIVGAPDYWMHFPALPEV